MVETIRLRLDRIASSTRNAKLPREVLVGPEIVAEEGYVLAVRVLNDKVTYNQLEDVTGRLIDIHSGDVIAGVLGRRRALKGYAGDVPTQIRVGDTLQLLNMGGIIGRCTSAVPEVGPPFDVSVIGAVLRIPHAGDRIGEPTHIRHGAVPAAKGLVSGIPPVVYVAGSAMNSGKTVAAIELVRRLSRLGLRVAATKLTGVSLRRDSLGMLDAGAVDVVTFNDVGVATTYDHCAVDVARGIFNHLATAGADVIVAELGDGILGEYGVSDILQDEGLAALGGAFVVCAPDQVAAWGAAEIFRVRFGLPITAIAGPVTDSGVGRDYIRRELGLEAHNARHDAEGLTQVVRNAVMAKAGAA